MVFAQKDIIGQVTPPPGVRDYGPLEKGGLINFANNLIKLIIVVAGLYTLLNLILAGYAFMSAGGDSKKIEDAWAKIWQSLVGLLIIAASFLLAALFGWLLFGDVTAILSPKIYGP